MNSLIRSAKNDLYQFISYANTTEDAGRVVLALLKTENINKHDGNKFYAI